MINYVIFDMDGTLLDTEKLFQKSWNDVGVKWGLEGIEDMYQSIIGRSVDTIIQMLEEKYGPKTDCYGFFRARTENFKELISKEIPIKKGCTELLKFLKEHNIPMALATSTPLYMTENNLAKTGIGEYLDAVVTADMVENGKPAPDIFIEAGIRIGAKAHECLVCEDSYNGIRAAYAAGMKPVMIPDMLQPTSEIKQISYAMVDSLLDVIELIKKENKII